MFENKITNEELCEFLGWYAGDGCISVNERYSEFALTGDISEEYPFYQNVIMPTFNRLFANYLKKPAVLKRYKKVGVCGIYVFDKLFVSLLQTKFYLKYDKKTNVSIPPVVKTTDDKKYFLRGLCDTDGSIYFCRSNVRTKQQSLFSIFHYKPKIKIATISKVLIGQVYDILLSLGFSPRLNKPLRQREGEHTMYAVVLDTKQDVKRWFKEVGFKSQKHLTKIRLWEQFGFCPPHTTLKERIDILNGKLNPLVFYPKHSHLSIDEVKKNLATFSNVTRGHYKRSTESTS